MYPSATVTMVLIVIHRMVSAHVLLAGKESTATHHVTICFMVLDASIDVVATMELPAIGMCFCY